MGSESWQENEIAQAYDAKFQILEAARREYDQAVLSLLEDLRTTLLEKNPQDGLADGCALEVGLKDGGGFAQKMLECRLKIGNNQSRIQAVSRCSAPWVGVPGFLQLGVASILDERLIASSPENLRRTARVEGLWDQDQGKYKTTGGIKGEPHWIHEENISLNDPELVDIAAERIRRLLTSASEIALQIEDEHQLAQRVIGALERIRKGLETVDGDSGCKVKPSLGWWQGMRYAQIDLKGQPSYWVGYHVQRKCLMYGHSRPRKCPELVHEFASAVDCHRTEVHGGSPAGVLLGETEIEKTTDEDLIKQIEATFSLFEDTAKGCA